MNLDIDGLKVNYKVTGTGKNVVLLHGWGCCIKTFEPVHNYLEKNFCTYSIDLPGFGESQEPPTVWGVKEYGELIIKFLEKLNIENPILIGHSFGGKVSIFVASSIKVNKVILVDSAGVKPKRKPSYYFKIYSYKLAKHTFSLPFLRKYKDEVLSKFKKKSGSADYRNASGMMQKILVKSVNEAVPELMPKIKAPVLLIWGENDTATPVADGKVMEKLMVDAGLVVLKNAGHYAYLDKFYEFTTIISNFLKKDMV